MSGRRLLKFLGTLGVATAGGYLAFLTAAFLVLEAPRLLLAVFTDVEFYHWQARRAFPQILPQILTRFPPDGSALLYALYRGGFLVSSAVVLTLGVVAAPRARGWLRLFSAQTVVWSAVLVVLYAGLSVVWTWGPINAALFAVWPAHAASLPLRISVGVLVAALALAAAYHSVRHLLDSAAQTRAGRFAALARWLLVPVGIVGLLITTNLFHWWSLLLGSITVGIVVVVLLTGLPAATRRARPAPPLRPSFGGAVILLGVLGLTLSGLLGYTKIARLAGQAEFSADQSQHWQLYFEKGRPVQAQRAALATAADERLAALAGRLGLELPNPALRAYFHTSTESKHTLVGGDEPFTLEPRRRIMHHLLAPNGKITDARGDALLLLRAKWGPPGSEAVARALARYAVGDFHGQALADYAARITGEERAYSLGEIFQLDTDYLSPLVRDALSGAWVEFVVKRHGGQVLAVLYRTPLAAGAEEKFARALGSSWKELEGEWRRFLLDHPGRPTPAPAAPRSSPASFFRRGISFSHEVGGEWGYGSDRALQELVRIRALGANAIAIVPYAFTQAPREVQIYFATAESDDRVIRTVEAAQQLGLRVMLKPQLWTHSFTGNIVFDDNKAFERWFSLYRRWLRHFARLAELYDVDLLVIGAELAGVTHREAAWRALIRDVRRIYSGPLTYAAHWDSEFETLPFWDALDYLGVNMYYPLAPPGEIPRPDSPHLQALSRQFAALARKYRKPVLFTEVGYPSITTAAAKPWEEGRGALDLELQRRCYATVFDAFYDQPWLAGLYWWKWPSHGGGTPYDPSYNPIGKPALEVLARRYGQASARQEVGGPPEARYTHPTRQEER
ncbi:MAG: hypothetical protein ACE5HL_03025 [Terriglobia bacterium]